MNQFGKLDNMENDFALEINIYKYYDYMQNSSVSGLFVWTNIFSQKIIDKSSTYVTIVIPTVGLAVLSI